MLFLVEMTVSTDSFRDIIPTPVEMAVSTDSFRDIALFLAKIFVTSKKRFGSNIV
jgi:hypothetical protein